MIKTHSKHLWWTVAAACAVLLSAGCASDGGRSATTSAGNSLLLGSQEFPSGAMHVELPRDKVAAGFGNVNGTANNNGPVTVTPAECAGVQQDLAAQLQELMRNASFTGAQTADGTVFTEIISDTAADLGKISDVTNRCQQMTLTTSVVGKQLTNTTVTIETLPLPGELNGIGAIAYHTSSHSDVVGNPVTTSSYTAYAVIGGMTIAMHAENLTGKSDDETFESLFDSAVQKVRDAT